MEDDFSGGGNRGGSSIVPPEYQNDPDLWYAIQASLGNETSNAVGGGGQNQDFMATNDLFGMGGSGGNDDGGGAAMDIDEELGAHHSGVQVAHNVSMDAGCGGDSPRTPKRRANVGPIFDESEFEPAGIRLQVHQSALTTQQQNQNQQPAAKKKQMTRQEHAKLMREQKQAKFLERRELAQQKMMQSSSICTTSQSNVNNF